jgi:hypothetical protein
VQRDTFSLRWLLAAAGLVLLNNFLLNRGYGLLPHLIPPSQWNWQGKLLALAATLAIASLPAFGWKRSGLTLALAAGSLKSAAWRPSAQRQASEGLGRGLGNWR